jgi:hypothetical protein
MEKFKKLLEAKIEKWEKTAAKETKKFFRENGNRVDVEAKGNGILVISANRSYEDDVYAALELLQGSDAGGLPDLVDCRGDECGFEVEMLEDESYWKDW